MGLRIRRDEPSQGEELVDREEEGVNTGEELGNTGEELGGHEETGGNNNNPIDGTREGLGGRMIRVMSGLGKNLVWGGLKMISPNVRGGDRLLHLIRQEAKVGRGDGVEERRAAIHRSQERVLRSLAQGVESKYPFPNRVLQAAMKAEGIPSLRSRYSKEPIGREGREVREKLLEIARRVVRQENNGKE